MTIVTEVATRRINERVYVDTGKDNIFTVRYKGEPAPDYVVKNGREYEVVNSKEYNDKLRNEGAKTVSAKKFGKVVVVDSEKETVNGEFSTYTSQGNIEATEKLLNGSVLIARADENGKPFIDGFGHANIWQIKEEKLRERYSNVPENISVGMSFEPISSAQDFTQVSKNIAIAVPWGENGNLIMQTIDAGGYLTSTSEDDYYGIAEDEFNNTYRILENKTITAKNL